MILYFTQALPLPSYICSFPKYTNNQKREKLEVELKLKASLYYTRLKAPQKNGKKV